MFKNLSTKTKILAGVAIVAIIAAAIVLVIILTGGNTNDTNKTNEPNGTNSPSNSTGYSDIKNAANMLPDQTALDYILAELDGYWVSGAWFVGFSSQGLEYGLLQSGYWISGEIVGSGVTGENSFGLTLLIPARMATELENIDLQPEHSETVYVDVSNFSDGRINIKLENSTDNQWYTYEYIGKSLTEIE
ncbi:hypothetical protein FWH58_00495 [Candidatus Saccharibacteria bacterium]|nr:hypothetical protein [Candidatus Saccharibacteria bacterium]